MLEKIAEAGAPELKLEIAGRIRAAVSTVCANGVCTPDVGGSAKTADVSDAIVVALARPAPGTAEPLAPAEVRS